MNWQGVIGISLGFIIFGLIILAILQAIGVTNIPWRDIGWFGPGP